MKEPLTGRNSRPMAGTCKPRIGYFAGPMRIGVPKESAAGEHRVALVPEVVGKLKAKGLDVLVAQGAGAGALLPDDAFAQAGAEISADTGAVWGSDVVVTISPPAQEQIAALGPSSLLIGFLAPLTSPATTPQSRPLSRWIPSQPLGPTYGGTKKHRGSAPTRAS